MENRFDLGRVRDLMGSPVEVVTDSESIVCREAEAG